MILGGIDSSMSGFWVSCGRPQQIAGEGEKPVMDETTVTENALQLSLIEMFFQVLDIFTGAILVLMSWMLSGVLGWFSG